MSIVGIGTDLVEIARLEAAMARFGRRFAERILGPRELEEWVRSAQPARFLAKRFAAKEATVKALGTGIRDRVRFVDIQVDHDALGKPRLALSGGAAERAQALGAGGSEVSLSDERQYALAFVILFR